MNILIDIGHPAHVHLFKNFAQEMIKRRHNIMFTCRDKEFEVYLLKFYGFDYKSFGKKYKSTTGKLLGMIKFDIKEILTGLKFKPDILLSHGSIYAAHAAFFLRKPHISFEDTFNFEQIKLYKPFTNTILTGTYDHPIESEKVIKYKGYHELAYLHPNWFKPNPTVLKDLNVSESEKFIVIRFVSWDASHDNGHTGISTTQKIDIVNSFSKECKVFISSEKELPEDLIKYKLPTSPEDIHSVIYYSSLLFGESGTMATEASVLGVPSIFIDNTGRLYTKEIQLKFNLCHCYSESVEEINNAQTKALEIIKNIDYCYKTNHKELLASHIDVSAFLTWFIENFPKSKRIMKENPDFQNKFK